MGKVFKPLWHNLYAFGQIFITINGQIYWKHKLVTWSHCSSSSWKWILLSKILAPKRPNFFEKHLNSCPQQQRANRSIDIYFIQVANLILNILLVNRLLWMSYIQILALQGCYIIIFWTLWRQRTETLLLYWSHSW